MLDEHALWRDQMYGQFEQPGPPSGAQQLAAAHWSYIESLLQAHGVADVEMIGFHYRSAFVHGYKHGVEDRLSAGSK